MGKKLLVVSERFWPEETDINEIVKFFTSAGIKTDVLCGKPAHPGGGYYKGYSAFGNKEERYEGVVLYRAAELKKQGALGPHPLRSYISFAISSGIRLGKIRKNQYDAVFIYQTSPVFQGRAALSLAAKRRINSVMYVADLWPDAIYTEMDIRDPLLKRIFRAVSYDQYKKAGRLIACCAETERYLISQIAASPGEVVYIPPFSSELFSRSEMNEKIQECFMGSFNLLYAGPVDEEEPFGMFFKTARRLIGAGLGDVRFIIAGEGRCLDELKKKADREGLYDTFFWVGGLTRENAPGYLYAADALLCAENIDIQITYQPARQVIDYLGAGKPLIAAVRGEGREIIKEARCGIVSEPEDEDGLFDNIVKLYKTPKEELKQMGQRARLYQLRHYDIESCAQQILDTIFPED